MMQLLAERPAVWSLRLRFIAIFLSAGFCWFVESAAEENVSLAIIIIAGLSHYFFAYLYRYRSKGYESSQYMVAAATLAVLGGLTYFLPAEFFIGIAAGYFVVHFLLDEEFLSGRAIGLYSWLRMIPIIILYWSYYACYLTGFSMMWSQIAAYLSVGLVMLWLFLSLLQSRSWGLLDWHCISIYAFSFIFVTAGVSVHGKAYFEPLGFLVISHVVSWYLHQGIKISVRGEGIGNFVREVLWMNLAVASLFLVYYLYRDEGSPFVGVLGLFFQPTFFYIWMMLHFISSFRASDFRRVAV
ncbi:hypothetical protein [Alcanivorax sp. 1008]|uniref:hypothetical protein n=1 Tax=Alcanivorax sp. 1008 TaxID=2816853 RepID=UPI001D2A6363|nr:hypothetical protein [Alcanivorax sp. 1008]MCC1498060.1 hypothetical protein [Alcanivorax sp. 1008]